MEPTYVYRKGTGWIVQPLGYPAHTYDKVQLELHVRMPEVNEQYWSFSPVYDSHFFLNGEINLDKVASTIKEYNLRDFSVWRDYYEIPSDYVCVTLVKL